MKGPAAPMNLPHGSPIRECRERRGYGPTSASSHHDPAEERETCCSLATAISSPVNLRASQSQVALLHPLSHWPLIEVVVRASVFLGLMARSIRGKF